MEEKYSKALTVLTAKELGDSILSSIKYNLDDAVNLAESGNCYGAFAAVGRAQIAMKQFMDLWYNVGK